jgi:RNA ligase (TIGR02306 family)
MSTFIVPVVEIGDIQPHTNADSLELLTVLGWQVCGQKGAHHIGEKVVYFPPDTVMSPDLSDRFGVTKYLDKGRIRCTKLRGEPSFGLIVKPDSDEWEIGANVAEHYDVHKYEPPVKVNTRSLGTRGTQYSDALPEVDLFPRYTGIENMRHFPDVLQKDEVVVVTEKIHGCCSRVGFVEGEWMVGSHRTRRKLPEEETFDFEGEHRYWYPLSLPCVRAMLQILGENNKQVVLYGEIYGSAVQSLSYGKKGELGYRAFDLLIDGKYVNYDVFISLCNEFEVSFVPVLAYLGYRLNHIKDLSTGKTTLLPEDQAHIREGVVVRPISECTNPKIGRVILKYVSDAYLLNKNISDYSEV